MVVMPDFTSLISNNFFAHAFSVAPLALLYPLVKYVYFIIG